MQALTSRRAVHAQYPATCPDVANINWLRRAYFAVVGLLLLFFVFDALLILAAPGSARINDHPGLLLSILLAVALLSKTEDLMWLPDEDCASLATLCEEHRSLMAYRDEVCAAGRRFTCGEFKAMKSWAARQQLESEETLEAALAAQRQRDGRRRLYGHTQS